MRPALARAGESGLASLRVTQLLDMGSSQQELSRDYATGLRLAFAEMRDAQMALPRLVTVETDGSAAQARAALARVREDPSQLALLGTVGESLALRTMEALRQDTLDIAHLAPWLSDTRFDADPRLVGLFASREEQLRHVLRSLSLLGATQLALVYPDAGAARAQGDEAQALGAGLNLKVQALAPTPTQRLDTFAAQLPADTPFFLVFMGTSVELARFTRGLDRRGVQRYVVCLSGVDPQAFVQLAPDNRVPVVFTQVVPSVRSTRVQMVGAYRRALARYFDEQPSPVSLAGYVAGRYAAQLLQRAGPAPTRERVLALAQERRQTSVDDWPLNFKGGLRASGFVEQVLLSADGRLVTG